MNPLVTVCVPTYNRERFLNRCLRSILTQTIADISVIVVDNASTDKTRERIASLRDSRVHYVLNPENLGMVGNWNRCLELALAKGAPFIAIFHDDDWYAPTILERELRFLADNPKTGLVQTAFYQAIDKTLRPKSAYPSDRVMNLDEMIEAHLQRGLCNTPSVLARRQTFAKTGLFEASLRILTDLDYWLRALDFCDMGFIAEPLYAYRLHSGQGSAVDDFSMPLEELRTVLRRTIERVSRRDPNVDVDSRLRSFDLRLARYVLRSAAKDSLLKTDHEGFERACTYALKISKGSIRKDVALLRACDNPFGRLFLSAGLRLKKAAGGSSVSLRSSAWPGWAREDQEPATASRRTSA